MGKKEDIKDAGKSAFGKQGTEISGSNIVDSTVTTADIKTVQDLEACFPGLVSEIRNEVIEKIEMCSAGQLKENMPELYERIVMEIQGKRGPDLNVPGFLLEVDDPIAAGTLRAFQKLKGLAGLRLPYVLPYKEKVTKAALENYILRADGSGDIKRAQAAREAMKKIK